MASPHRPLLPGLILLAGLYAAACGGSDSPSATTAAGSPSATSSASPGPSSTAGAAPQTIDLAAASSLLTITPPDLLDFRTGISSIGSGDFNGDGIADLLLGLPFGDGPGGSREDGGEAYVIFGNPDLSGQIDLATNQPDFTVWGALPGDNLGFGVAGGDLNGDGIDDIIVGAPGSNALENLRTDLGQAYVIFGRHDMSGQVDTLNREQDFTLTAAEGFARLGSSFAVADVNGDGTNDLIAGAPFGGREPNTPPGGPRTTVGEVYIVFGGPGLRGEISVAKEQQDVAFSGAAAQNAFGQAVAAGDVDGDGIADIIVGARGYAGPGGAKESAGAVFVFSGSRDLSGRHGIGDARTTILGADAGDSLGDTLAAADINGDGLADIAAVARSSDGPDGTRSEAGEAAIIFGSEDLSGTRDLATMPAGAVVYGPDAGDLLGTGVLCADLNGDGHADLAFGAPLTDIGSRSLSGAAYVVFSNALSGVKDLKDDRGDTITITGAADHDALGTGAAAADFNGDGRLELVLMAAADQGQAEQRRGTIYMLTLP